MNMHRLVLGDYETNCYILWGQDSKSCVVIDPGYEPDRILATLQQLQLELAAVLLTHGHFDHVGGVRRLFEKTDCDIYLCPADCQLPERMTAGQLCYTHSYQDADALSLAGLSIRVLQTPGHTPGSVCLFCQDHLFAGDTLFAGSCGRTDLPGGSWEQMTQSLAKLRALPENYKVFPGHGEATDLDTQKKYNPYMR